MAKVPAVIKKVLAIESVVKIRNITENVIPLRIEYKIKTNAAILELIFSIHPARKATKTTSNMPNPINTHFPNEIIRIKNSEDDTHIATNPVIINARDIQP